MLLQRVEKTLRTTGMAPTRFGRESLGDPKFVFDLRNGRDPRLSRAGDQAARRVGMLLEQLAKLESWLRHDGRAQLKSYDRPLLAPGFRRLAQQSRPVADLSQELAEELGAAATKTTRSLASGELGT